MLWTVLIYRLDAAAFGLFCLGMLAMLHLAIRRGGGRGVPRSSWWVLAAIVILGALLAELIGRHQERSARHRLQSYATTYAQEMTRLGHAQLPSDASPDHPLYRSLADAQCSWLRVNPEVADIYTVRKLADARVTFIVDSETDYDGNGHYEGDREQRTPIGTPFDDVDEKIQKAFAGQLTFDAEPWTDRWGTWVSAYCPMFRPDRTIEAVLGVDYHAEQWLAAVVFHRAVALFFTAVAIAGHVVGGIAMWHYRRLLAERTQMALHDRLTGLPNRVLLHDQLSQTLQRFQKDPGQSFALIFLDLDSFKLINDSLGHAIGDLLLVEVARRLCEALGIQRLCVNSTDSILPARLGGDEFVVLLKEARDIQQAITTARQIQNALAKPFVLAGRDVCINASLGIAASHQGYTNADDLLRDADTAMYSAKSGGKARFMIFDQQMREQVVARLNTEQDLRKAIDLQQLHLVFQPIVNLTTGRLVGFESLLRWQHPQRGMISPAEFIPLAEETGLILPIGTWVLEQVCQVLARWRAHYPQADFFITANVSRRQMDAADWVQSIHQVIHRIGADPRQLKLEITESAVMSDPDASVQALKHLRQLGVGIYVDDFGTGQSSLACLHRFPFTGLKLDRTFIASLSENRSYMAVVSAIVSLAYSFDMQVTAEGIEQPQQIALLQSLGCHDAQGYLFAKPMPLDQAERLLSDGLPIKLFLPNLKDLAA